MQLQDLENACLSYLLSQTPPPNFGGAPAWSSFSTNSPKYPQAMVDNAINRAINRLMDDMGDLELGRFSYTFTSVAQQYEYAIPAGAVAQGTLTLSGTIASGVVFTITIGGTPITYTSLTTDASLAQLLASLTTTINSSTVVTSGTVIGPVSPSGNAANQLTLTASVQGTAGNAITLTSTSSSGSLLLTASGATLTGGTAASPLIKMVQRVRYQPQGLPYKRDFVPGAKLISYKEYEQYTGAGYLAPYSFGTEPLVCAVTPSRTKLAFFPGPNTTGDIITLEYEPIPTVGTSVAPLVNATDSPYNIPEDWYDAIVYGALSYLWMVSRESGAQADYRKMYLEEVDRLKTNYRRASAGDAGRIVPQGDMWDNVGIGSYGASWF